MKTTTISSDHVEVVWDGREFGGQETPTAQFQRECPEGLRVVAGDLTKQSALVQLNEFDCDLTKNEVFKAYASDLQLLQRYVNEFESFVKSAARASIMMDSNEDVANKETEAMWQELEQQLPPISRQRPLLALPNTLAAKGAADILHDLKLQFVESVQCIVQLFTYWLHALAEEEVVGLMEWNDIDVGRYHYFCRVAKESILNEKYYDEVNGTQGKRIRERKLHRERFFERHIHHLVDAQLHSLDDYKMGMPPRVERFIASVPGWLKPQLQVVDGQMTMEEVLRWKTGDKTEVDCDVVATFRYDPAICLGDFVLVGWSGSEVQSIKKERTQKKKENWDLLGVALISLFIIASFLTLVIWVLMNDASRLAAEKTAFAAYLDNVASLGSHVGSDVKEVRQFEPLDIAGTNSQFLFRWYTPYFRPIGMEEGRPASITIHRKNEEGIVIQDVSFALEHGEFISPYGDIDLAPRFDVPVTIHVIGIQKGEGNKKKDVLRYRVSYNQ